MIKYSHFLKNCEPERKMGRFQRWRKIEKISGEGKENSCIVSIKWQTKESKGKKRYERKHTTEIKYWKTKSDRENIKKNTKKQTNKQKEIKNGKYYYHCRSGNLRKLRRSNWISSLKLQTNDSVEYKINYFLWLKERTKSIQP